MSINQVPCNCADRKLHSANTIIPPSLCCPHPVQRAPLRLRDLLDETLVKVGLEGLDKETCIAELIDLLVRSGRISDRASAMNAVKLREAEGTTGIGKGCAVPHGKHAAITGLHVALGTSASGVDFEAVDDAPVHLVLLILANENEPGPNIRALAEVVRLLAIPGFYQRVVGAQSTKSILDVLDAEE